MYSKHLLISCMLVISVSGSYSQNDWTLKLDKEGIRVYTKNNGNSSFKAIRTVCTLETTLTKLTAVVLDINGSVDWVYATKKCRLLRQVSPSELYYYSEVEVPWPVSNRDFIVRLKVSQDERTRAITIIAENKPDYLPLNKNIVRIPQSYSKWYIEPLPGGQVKMEYVLQVDPGGSVPAWLINLFATRGPYESFKNLRLQVKKPIYNKVNLPFIRN